MLTILVILLIIAVLGGGFGYRSWGAAGMSPAGILVVLLLLLWLTGNL